TGRTPKPTRSARSSRCTVWCPCVSCAAMAELDGTARALARIPSGLFVLCAGREPPGLAMLVSFVQQVGFQPPAISVAPNKQRDRALALLRAERPFCLAVIGDGDRPRLARYARGAGHSDPVGGA